jgi:hypothetical protein
MIITSNYWDITRGDDRCLFFLLIEDYLQAQTQFFEELSIHLERFARTLSGAGSVVRPFTGDIDQSRIDILEKPWTDEEREQIEKTPGLLMIDADSFAAFDPRSHNWLQIHFGQKMNQGVPGVYEFAEPLKKLALAVKHSEDNIFDVAYRIMNPLPKSEALKIFSAKPGIFGFSIDLIQAGGVLQKLCQRMLREQP